MLRGGGFRLSRSALGRCRPGGRRCCRCLRTTPQAPAGRTGRNASAAESYQPSYASIVVDANSGAVMQATNADSPRHPASLTKIMTLYLLFERLEQARSSSPPNCQYQLTPPCKRHPSWASSPGETIRVETAIRAIVTKSANDVAVIVAEALGGDEASFAKMMTAKAQRARHEPDDLSQCFRVCRTTSRSPPRAIRPSSAAPSRTDFRTTISISPPGLSNTAASRCGTTIICSAPSTASTASRLATFAIPGSTSSLRSAAANRHIVAVVFGGRTANARDARVRSLIDNNINIAAVKRTAPPVIEGSGNSGRAKRQQGRQRG